MSREYKDGRLNPKTSVKTELESGSSAVLLLRMTPDLKDRLKRASQKAKRSMNNYICYVLDQSLRKKAPVEKRDPETSEDTDDNK